MKLEHFFGILIILTLITISVGYIISDLRSQYPEVTVDSDWEDTYDYVDEVNESVSSIKEDLESIGQESGGWAILTSFIAVPKAVIKAITLVLSTPIHLMEAVGTLLSEAIGVPTEVVAILVVIVIMAVVFTLIKFWRRFKED